MSDERHIVDTAAVARGELPLERTKPSWTSSSHLLPLNSLSPDEFEVVCFLVLQRENPDDQVLYYGKTADRGRDIVIRRDSGTFYVQCKRYVGTVGVGEIRAELAKLYFNTWKGLLPETPDALQFYVSEDFSAQAQDLLDSHEAWIAAAPAALKALLKEEPTAELLQHVKDWWPRYSRVNGHEISDRLRKHDDLITEFFGVRSVVDSASVEEMFGALQKQMSRMELSVSQGWEGAHDRLQNEISRMGEANPGLEFSATTTSTGVEWNVRARPGETVPVGKLHFPDTEAGAVGKQKFKQMIDFGHPVKLRPSEHAWISELAGQVAPAEDATQTLLLTPQVPEAKAAICIRIKGGQTLVRYAEAGVSRVGRKEVELVYAGRGMAGTFSMVFGPDGVGRHIEVHPAVSGAEPDSVIALYRLAHALSEGAMIEIVSLESGEPMMEFAAGLEMEAQAGDYLAMVQLAKMVKTISGKMGVHLLFPEEMDENWGVALELVFGAVTVGRVVESVAGKPFHLSTTPEMAEEIIGKLSDGVTSFRSVNEMPLTLGGVELDLGEQVLFLEDIELEDVSAQKTVNGEPRVEVHLRVARIVREFTAWLVQDDDGGVE